MKNLCIFIHWRLLWPQHTRTHAHTHAQHDIYDMIPKKYVLCCFAAEFIGFVVGGVGCLAFDKNAFRMRNHFGNQQRKIIYIQNAHSRREWAKLSWKARVGEKERHYEFQMWEYMREVLFWTDRLRYDRNMCALVLVNSFNQHTHTQIYQRFTSTLFTLIWSLFVHLRSSILKIFGWLFFVYLWCHRRWHLITFQI